MFAEHDESKVDLGWLTSMFVHSTHGLLQHKERTTSEKSSNRETRNDGQ
jgi:hypothetical protein